MAKYKKSELLSSIQTLKKVNNEIKKRGIEMNDVADVLAQCQQLAISIGTYLEENDVLFNKVVAYLEDYCENLYQMSLCIDNASERARYAKKIEYSLGEAEREIEKKHPADKRIIAFFPYKASMWDSMETIWECAVKDSRCRTYVIPIPYYEKDENGNLVQLRCEKGLFAQEVNALDWENAELDELGIDVAYIHNPYGEHNKVTCVHPDYQILQLKKIAKKIIYVPYFVSLNYVEEHFCLLPGVFYSDNVVVQTGKIKEMYLEYLRQFERQNDLGTLLTENSDKIVALGNPKFDKVLKTDSPNVQIPSEWLSKIYRKDGSKKKIVLFNTSLQELLTYKELQIKRIEQVINLCKEKEGVVLLWRPHPLNESTMQAMIPSLLNKYIELIETFKNDNIGIYDDTADLHRAIAISDAYYGTGGSLVPLFGMTGKPILRQNTELPYIRDNALKQYVSLERAFVDTKGDIWFATIEFNGLFKYNTETEQLSWKGRFPEEGYEMQYRYSGCVTYNNKLFFPPYLAKEFAVFDIKTETFEKIPVADYDIKGPKTYGRAQYKNKLFCFGASIPAIICLNMDTYELEYYEELYKEISPYFVDETAAIINRDVIIEDNICWLVSGRTNIVVEFHMDTLEYKIHRVGSENNYYAGMKKFDGKFYLWPRNAANIVCWDNKNNIEYEILTDNQSECVANAYSNACIYDDELWLFAFKGQYIGKIKKGTDVVELVEDMSEYAISEVFNVDANEFSEQKISWAYSDENYIYYFSYMNKTLYIKDMKNGTITKRYLKMSKEDLKQSRNMFIWQNRDRKCRVSQFIYQEKTTTMLADYLDWICGDENLYSQKQVEVFLNELSEGHANCGQLCHERFNLRD